MSMEPDEAAQWRGVLPSLKSADASHAHHTQLIRKARTTSTALTCFESSFTRDRISESWSFKIRSTKSDHIIRSDAHCSEQRSVQKEWSWRRIWKFNVRGMVMRPNAASDEWTNEIDASATWAQKSTLSFRRHDRYTGGLYHIHSSSTCPLLRSKHSMKAARRMLLMRYCLFYKLSHRIL